MSVMVGPARGAAACVATEGACTATFRVPPPPLHSVPLCNMLATVRARWGRELARAAFQTVMITVTPRCTQPSPVRVFAARSSWRPATSRCILYLVSGHCPAVQHSRNQNPETHHPFTQTTGRTCSVHVLEIHGHNRSQGPPVLDPRTIARHHGQSHTHTVSVVHRTYKYIRICNTTAPLPPAQAHVNRIH